MSGLLGFDLYGKSDVRVTKVTRGGGVHDLVEISVDVTLYGKFADSYFTGDNSKVIATDSIKNTVYALAKDHPLDSIDGFAAHLAGHFKNTYPQVKAAEVRIRQHPWQRLGVAGKPHPHAFISGGSELRTCQAAAFADRTDVAAGLTDLLVLKTTDSAFEGFVRDEFTTLKDTSDRIFATRVTADWPYVAENVDYNAAYGSIRTALLETFSTHMSLSVQQTLYAMGQAALRVCDAIGGIRITMPNKHRILVDLKPFGRENDNEIFVWTDEPYGNITGHITRS